MKLFSRLKCTSYALLYLLLLAFLLLKMVRGMYGAESSSGGIWNVIQLIFVFVGAYFFASKYGRENHPINILLVFSLWIVFISLINAIRDPITSLSSWFYLLMSPCAPLVLLVFYCAGIKNGTNCLPIIIKATYYGLIALFYFSMTNYRIVDSDEFIAFSDVYYPMCLLPLVLLLTKPGRSFIPLLAILVGIIVSGKRGGLIVVAVIAVLYYFVGENRKIGTRILMIALLIGVIAGSSFLIDYIDAHYGLNTLERMMRAGEDGGSGRIERWNLTLNEIGSSSFSEILFGHGFDAVYDIDGGRTHNDFLEVLYNYGLVSAFIYTLFYIRLIALNIKQYRKRYPYSKYLTCSLVVALVLAMVSFYIVEPTYILSSMFVMGILLGDWERFCRGGYR